MFLISMVIFIMSLVYGQIDLEHLEEPKSIDFNTYTIVSIIVLIIIIVLKVIVSNFQFFKRNGERSIKSRPQDESYDLTELKKEHKEHRSILDDLKVRLSILERLFESHLKDSRRDR